MHRLTNRSPVRSAPAGAPAHRRGPGLALLAALAASATVATGPALAAEPVDRRPPPAMVTGLDPAAIVPDADLADMRGKFIRADQVRFFGVSMATSWQDAAGVTTAARMTVSIAFAPGADRSSAVPVITIGWVRDGDASMDVPGFGQAAAGGYVAVDQTGRIIPVSGLGSVHGVVQGNVVAGTGNQVANGMQLVIVPASTLADIPGAGNAGGGRTDTLGDGDTVGFIIAPGQLGLVLTDAQTGGSASQGITASLGQLAQAIQLTGDGHSIGQSMAVTLGLDALPQLQAIRIDNALSAMKGRGF